MWFLLSSNCISSNIWMHHMDADKVYKEKSRWELHKKVIIYTEQILEATSHKQQLYGHLPPISKAILVRQTRHAGHCWRRKNKIISYVLLWTPSHRRVSVGRPRWTYLRQLCMDTGCRLEKLPGAIDDRDDWWERVREIFASSAT